MKEVSGQLCLKDWKSQPDISECKSFVEVKHVEEFSGTRKRALEKEPASHISISSSLFLTAEGPFSGAPPGPFPPLSHEGMRSCPSPARGSGSLQAGSALRLLLLLVLSPLLLEGCSASSSSSSSWHSLYYSYTFVSEPSQGLPRFSILESLDDQPIARYDSNTQEYRSLVPWMEEVKKQEPLWELYTRIARKAEQDFERNLVTLQKYYNHSAGFHTLQWRYGCKQNNYGEQRGSDQDGYDGRTFISFDKETLTWTGADAAAQVSKRKLEGEPSVAKRVKYYLEEICIEMLRKRLKYGKEALLKKEPPTVKVTRKAEASEMETHICRADGFFPKEIKATWMRDGEVWLQDTFHGLVTPNSDGTYHFWLNIRIDPKDRDHFQCHVEHDSLQEPLDLALKEPAPHPTSLISAFVTALLVDAIIIYLIYFNSKSYHWFIFITMYVLIAGFTGFFLYFHVSNARTIKRGSHFAAFVWSMLTFLPGSWMSFMIIAFEFPKRKLKPRYARKYVFFAFCLMTAFLVGIPYYFNSREAFIIFWHMLCVGLVVAGFFLRITSKAITFCLLLLNVFLAALLYYLPLEPRWEFMVFWPLLAIGLVLVIARFILWFMWIMTLSNHLTVASSE